ncbi:RLP18, partial [Symbiodinium sp. KB8]
MPKRKKGKKSKAPPPPALPRDFTAIQALDGAAGAIGIEQMQFARKIDAVKMAMAEDVISAAVASGERGVSLSSLSLHALPDSLSSLAGLQELDLSDNFIVPGIFDHLSEFTALKALNLRKNFLAGPLPDALGANAQLTELELD